MKASLTAPDVPAIAILRLVLGKMLRLPRVFQACGHVRKIPPHHRPKGDSPLFAGFAPRIGTVPVSGSAAGCPPSQWAGQLRMLNGGGEFPDAIKRRSIDHETTRRVVRAFRPCRGRIGHRAFRRAGLGVQGRCPGGPAVTDAAGGDAPGGRAAGGGSLHAGGAGEHRRLRKRQSQRRQYNDEGSSDGQLHVAGSPLRRGRERRGARSARPRAHEFSRHRPCPANRRDALRRQDLSRPTGWGRSRHRRGRAEDRRADGGALPGGFRQFGRLAGWAAGLCHWQPLRPGADVKHRHHLQLESLAAQPAERSFDQVDHSDRRGNQPGQFRRAAAGQP